MRRHIIAEWHDEVTRVWIEFNESDHGAVALAKYDREIEVARKRRNERLSELNVRQDDRGKK